jgi:hypothetical protein
MAADQGLITIHGLYDQLLIESKSFRFSPQRPSASWSNEAEPLTQLVNLQHSKRRHGVAEHAEQGWDSSFFQEMPWSVLLNPNCKG